MTPEAPEEKKLAERGKRLYKNYRWNNEMYADLFDLQEGKCAGCGRPPRNAPLNVDHLHFHIEVVRLLPGKIIPYAGKCIPSNAKWYATVREMPDILVWGMTRKGAIQKARDLALPRSVRGLLCPGRQRGCNRLLGRVDDIHLLENFIKYLKNPPAKQILDKYRKA